MYFLKLIFCLALCAVSLTVFIKQHNKMKFPTPRIRVYIFALLFAFYASFSFMGQKFVPDDALFTFPLIDVVTFIILWTTLCIITILAWGLLPHIFERISSSNNDIKPLKNIFFKSFFIIFGFYFIYWIFYFPGAMSPDSYSFYYMGGNGIPTDVHGVLYPALISLFMKILKTLAIPILAQIVFASVTGALWISYLYQKGVRNSLVFWIFIIFWILPNNVVITLTLWKDVPYYYTYLCLLLMSLKIIDSSSFVSRYILGASFFAILLFFWRHNGIALTFLAYLWFIGLAWQRKSYKYVLYPVLMAIVMFLGIQVIYKIYNTQKSQGGVNTATLVVQPINTAYILLDDVKGLPDNAQEIAALLPKEEWKKRGRLNENTVLFPQQRLEDDDITVWEQGVREIRRRLGSGTDTIKLYLQLWFTNFDLQLRTRLNISPSLWNTRLPLSQIEGAALPASIGIIPYYKAEEVLTPWFTSIHKKTLDVTNGIRKLAVLSSFLFPLALCSVLILFFLFFDLVYKNFHKYAIIYLFWGVHSALLFFVATAGDYRYSWISLPTAFILVILRIIPDDLSRRSL